MTIAEHGEALISSRTISAVRPESLDQDHPIQRNYTVQPAVPTVMVQIPPMVATNVNRIAIVNPSV